MIRAFMRPAMLATAFSLGASSLAWGQADLLGRLSAGRVAAISDGDFVAQSYATGRLSPREAGHRDVLTVLSLREGRVVTGSLPLSNSVTAAPEILRLSPDGRTAFVTERLGERPRQGETVRDLPPGRRLFAVDLAEPVTPRLADTVEVAAFPEGLALSPDGGRVAVVSNTAEGSFVQVVDYAEGRFGPVARFDLGALGIMGTASGPRGGVTATNVQWHPSGRFMAVNINTQDRVAFFEIVGRGAAAVLRPWGAPVAVGADPFVGRFTPDGRHYLTSNWGRNFAAADLEGRIPEARSTISVVRFSAVEGAPHVVVGQAETGVSAEGIAVSPDGRLVATVNMRGTSFLPDSTRFQREASVALLMLDPATGALEKLGEYPLAGVLPEGGSFDLTGEHFLATVFQGHEGAGPENGPGLAVFRVVKGERPSLSALGRIPLPHGVHHVDVAR